MLFILTKIHAVLDYVEGILLILAPNLLGVADQSSAAVWIPRLLGGVLLLMTLITRYEAGVIKVVPMHIHQMVDVVAFLLLAASPFVLGFYNGPINQWMPHLMVGLGSALIALMTDPKPHLDVAYHL